MTITYVMMQNIRRNPLRTTLTALSFALPMAVFIIAISLVTLFVQTGINAEKQLRIATRNKVSLTNILPEGHRRAIEALDPNRERLLAVCGFRWFGGKVPATGETVQALGTDADTLPIVFTDLELTPEEIEKFQRDKRSAVVGDQLAKKYGWRVGERFTLDSNIPPYMSLEFTLVKTLPQVQRALSVFFRRDYLEDSLKERAPQLFRSGCNLFWVKCNSAAALESMREEIDLHFANSPNETQSDNENAFFATFQQALGDLPGLMQAMAIVVVGIMGLVAGNTMMMSFRERVRELAVFKAIGFQSSRIFFIVLSESMLLAVLGSLVGIIPAAIWLSISPLQIAFGPFGRVEFSPVAAGVALAIAVVVGLLAGLAPAWNALRLRTTDALRRVA